MTIKSILLLSIPLMLASCYIPTHSDSSSWGHSQVRVHSSSYYRPSYPFYRHRAPYCPPRVIPHCYPSHHPRHHDQPHGHHRPEVYRLDPAPRMKNRYPQQTYQNSARYPSREETKYDARYAENPTEQEQSATIRRTRRADPANIY